MIDDTAMTALLTELSSIANSAMTADQREKRAMPVVDAAEATLDDIKAALARPDMPWNVNKARAYGVEIEPYMTCLGILSADVKTVGELLDTLHRIEAAAAMLKAGYHGSRDGSGKLAWSRG